MIIGLSLGKLLVSQLQEVVKRTKTPLISLIAPPD